MSHTEPSGSLAVAAARAGRSPASVPVRDNRVQRAGVAEEFRVRAAGEVVDVDPAEHPAVLGPHGSGGGVHAVVAVLLDDAPGELDQFLVLLGQLKPGDRHASKIRRPNPACGCGTADVRASCG
jgi:hypothetical protein